MAVAVNHLETYFCLWLLYNILFQIRSKSVLNLSQSRKIIFIINQNTLADIIHGIKTIHHRAPGCE